MSETEIIGTYRTMRTELKNIADKINELEMDYNEHVRVLETISPLNASRKAFRLVGDILVERSVGEIMPALSSNKESLQKVIMTLTSSLNEKEKVANVYQVF